MGELFINLTTKNMIDMFQNYINVYMKDELIEPELNEDRYGRVNLRYSKEVAEDTDRYGRPIKETVIIRLEGKNGYGFTGDIYTEFYDYNTGNYENKYYTGDEFNRELTIETTGDDVTPENFEMVQVDLSTTQNLPFNKIYKMSEENLNELKKYNYIEYNYETGEHQVTPIEQLQNYGKYITGLYVYPFNIPIDNEVENVLLGNADTGVEGEPITEMTYKLDLGNIIIPKTISEGVGYKNVTIDLYVPYFKHINLDVDEVIGGRIDLSINVNLISGKGTLNIKNYDTDSVIHTEQMQIGTKIPYELSDNISINIGSDVLETDYTIPYVEMKVLRPDNTVSMKPIDILDLDKDFNYIKDTDDLIFSTIANEREQKLIKDMISRGIFVRK